MKMNTNVFNCTVFPASLAKKTLENYYILPFNYSLSSTLVAALLLCYMKLSILTLQANSSYSICYLSKQVLTS